MDCHFAFIIVILSLDMLSVEGLEPFPANVSHQPVGKMQLVSKILDRIMDNYDSNVRPGYISGRPLVVTINLHLRTMGPISEENMIYSMDLYFRQIWLDTRLEFNGTEVAGELRVTSHVLNKIWRPDTIFLNDKGSSMHTITKPNRLIRVFPNGNILYSNRMTIKASCEMDLRQYPMDNQSCALILGSFAYGSNDVLYRWDEAVKITQENISLAQFEFKGFSLHEMFLPLAHEQRNVLMIKLLIKRMIGYYLIQIYVPSYLTVAISWVSFWINREASPARVTLGVTTLLTCTTMALTCREGIPRVSYYTALDVFVMMCFCFVFAALLEYAGVNYFTKITLKEFEDSDSDGYDPDDMKELMTRRPSFSNKSKSRHNCPMAFWQCLRGYPRVSSHYYITHGVNSVSEIDRFSRVAFPAVFVFCNVLYWTVFINTS